MDTRKLRAFLILTTLLCAAGCGTKPEPQGSGQSPDMAGRAAPDAARSTAVVSGRITFSGTPPPAAAINLTSDPTCAILHKDPLYTEEIVVREGKLQNVFVWVKEGLEGYSFPPPAEPVVLSQEGCRFAPHVGGIMVGQKLRIVNADTTLHNIRCVAEKNPEFNIGQPIQGMSSERSFPSPEIMIRFKCDVHKWMSSYFGVVAHPYFSVTGPEGTYTLRNLPPGDYVIEAWHERFGTRTQKISVGEKETREVDFAFAPAS